MTFRSRQLGIEPLERRVLLAVGPLVISELLAANDDVLADADGDFSDWIEVYNPTDQDVELAGWRLTDDEADPNKWGFPELTLDAGQYLVVFASGKDRTDPQKELHTNFQLDAGGEYLALIEQRSWEATGAVAHRYAPGYAPQQEDFSYGLSQEIVSLVGAGEALSYRVPGAADAALETRWTDPDFDPPGFTDSLLANPIVITEAGLYDPDWIEIQNVGDYPVDVTGWVVALNYAQNRNINDVGLAQWDLTGVIRPGEVLFRHDDDKPNDPQYLGGDIFWRSYQGGWAMIVDDEGNVVDFVVWGESDEEWAYTEEKIAAMRVTVNGFEVTPGDAWSGPAVACNDDPLKTLRRTGTADQNNASDFAFTLNETPDESQGRQNAQLFPPFSGGGGPAPRTGIGFSSSDAFGDAIRTDLAGRMQGVNASVWTRIPFQVDNPSMLGGLSLGMRYEDGFIAYLNGREVARHNAPASPRWYSAATANRPLGQASRFEQFDLSDHTGLLRPGANVLAIHGLNDRASDGEFLILPELTALQTREDLRYFATPTPGGRNAEGYIDFVADTRFSVDRGFFDEPFFVEISTATPAATIRYTTDGTTPTEAHGTAYTAAIPITTTTVLRAAAFQPGHYPSNVDTQTYIFPDDVIRQPANPRGVPSTWGAGIPADYQMDPDVVNDRLYRDVVRDALRTHPTISLVMEPDDLWDPIQGIYANARKEGPEWERNVSIELIDFPEGDDLQVDAGVRIHGSASRQPSRPKHNFRLVFRKEYGLGKLEYPLFGHTDVQRFNDIILRGGNGDSWFHPNVDRRPQAQYTHDQWHKQTQVAMGQPTSQQGDAHVYVNGLYWGFYHVIERPEASYMEEHFGGDKEDYDVLQHKGGTVNGNRDAWNTMINLVRNTNLANDQAYRAVLQYIDPVDLADWMLLNFYSANTDWDHNNWYGARKRELGETWKFFSWDAEVTFRNLTADVTDVSKNDQPTEVHQRLSVNPEYRMVFADRVQKHFFNDGALTPAAVEDRWMTRAAEIEVALVAESARWADHHRPADPYTVEDEFRSRQNWFRTTWFPRRTGIVIDQLEARGMYPNVEAPAYAVNGTPQHGGQVSAGDWLAVTAPGSTIYYTLDGSDPRLYGGAVSPAALRYSDPVRIDQTTTVRSRVLLGGRWSALSEAEYLVGNPALAANLAITELNYHPHDPTAEEEAAGYTDSDDFEFIELQNTGDEPIDLSGAQFTEGIEITLTGRGAGSPVLITEAATGSIDYLEIQNVSAEAVDTSGWVVAINNAENRSINDVHSLYWRLPAEMAADEVLYQTETPGDHYWGQEIIWRPYEDGWAVLLAVTESNNAGNVADFVVWGYDADQIASLDVTIEGIRVTAADVWRGSAVPAGGTLGNSLQRQGRSDRNVASDWSFVARQSKGIRNALLTTPLGDAGLELLPGEFVVAARNEAAFRARYGSGPTVVGSYDKSLDNGGERIVLTDRFGTVIVDFTYDDKGSWPGRPDGKGASLELIDPGAVPATDPARRLYLEDGDHWRGSSEYAGSPGRTGAEPLGDVVINEVVSRSITGQLDWIELVNTTDDPIDLGGWYLSDSSAEYRKFRIPDGVLIAAGGYRVFDETDFNADPGAPGSFALSAIRGDDVWLLQADGSDELVRFVDHVEFGASATGESFGRWPDPAGEPYPMATPTPCSANADPRIGPLVIGEVMYNPPGPGGAADPNDFEFVEIFNASNVAVSMANWRIRGGIDFDFAATTELVPGATLIVVPFDVANASKRTALCNYYGLDESEQIVGGYTGVLDNGGERIELQRPGTPPQEEPDYIPRLLEDEVRYDDVDPWPAEPDGGGQSLTRRGANLWGNAAASWAAAPPTPGSTGNDDAYEPNDAIGTAYHPGVRWANTPLSSLAGPGIQANVDWYEIHVAANEAHLTVDLTFTRAEGNVDLELYDAAGELFARSESLPDNQQIDTVLPWPGIWYLRVSGDEAGNVYDLSWNDRYVNPGDANYDGQTDIRDFNVWNAHKFTGGTDWTTGDFNLDGRTDVRDFNIWNAHKFTSDPTPPPVDAVLSEDSQGWPAAEGHRSAALIDAAAGELDRDAASFFPDHRTATFDADELVGLQQLQPSGAQGQPSKKSGSAAAAVDKLLAVCLMYPDLFP